MRNTARKYDKTHLSIDTAEDRMIVHRDYLAHCLRWSHVIKYLRQGKKYQTANILDVGCGKEMPLAKLLYSNKMSGSRYCGVDINKLEIPKMLQKAIENNKMEIQVCEQTDASELKKEQLNNIPTIVVSFEAFEHMHQTIARKLIKNLYDISADDAVFFFSTPCWNGSAAGNHINETTYEAMGAMLEAAGWRIKNNYGTFASQTDYKDEMNDEMTSIYESLKDYYDTEMLAILFAPLFPDKARNCLWHCNKTGERKFKDLEDIPKPWSQNDA